jgi:hypothetical protein
MYVPGNLPTGFVRDTEGMLIHTYSGGKFPLKLGSFIRGNPYAFDSAGYNIAVGYSINDSMAAQTTIYIYPSVDLDLMELFSEVKSAIEYHQQDAHQSYAFEIAVELDDESTLSGYFAVYKFKLSFRGRKQMVESWAFLFNKGDWFIKFRISYPMAENQASMRRVVDSLVNSFDYPEISREILRRIISSMLLREHHLDETLKSI